MKFDMYIKKIVIFFLSKIHVACFVKHLLLLYLKKLKNMFLSLSTENWMHVVCFVKKFIVTLFKEIDKNK